jgi:hypothetical protein
LPSFWDKWNAYFDFLWTGLVSYAGPDYLISSFPDRRKITITGRDFVGTFIPGGSIATFTLPLDADFIADDTDHLWSNGVIQNNLTVTDLISGDYRTVVKYSNSAPFDITMIGLLRLGITPTGTMLNELHTDFLLWLFWTGVFNDYGYLKDNREIT